MTLVCDMPHVCDSNPPHKIFLSFCIQSLGLLLTTDQIHLFRPIADLRWGLAFIANPIPFRESNPVLHLSYARILRLRASLVVRTSSKALQISLVWSIRPSLCSRGFYQTHCKPHIHQNAQTFAQTLTCITTHSGICALYQIPVFLPIQTHTHLQKGCQNPYSARSPPHHLHVD